jgi:hypothetical protein
MKYKPANLTCCDTCTHRVLLTEYLCIVRLWKLRSRVWCQTWLILLSQLTIHPVYVCVSSESDLVKTYPHNLPYPTSPHNTRIPLRKETCSLTATIAQNHPWDHKIIPESPRLTYKRGNAGIRHTVADNGTRSGDLLERRRRTREEHPPSGKGERRRAAIHLLLPKPMLPNAKKGWKPLI